MNNSYTLGVDISKAYLDFCLLYGQVVKQTYRCPNTLQATIELLQALPVRQKNTLLICAEYTGIYGYNLIQAARQLGLILWMEDPSRIKYSGDLQRGKSDPVDARRIAHYGWRFADRARPVGHAHKTLDQLEYLQGERRLLVSDRAKYKAQLSDQKQHMLPEIYASKAKRWQALIKEFTRQINAIEHAMEQLLGSDIGVSRQYNLLQSIPGVGPRLAVYMIIVTKGFTRFDNPRALCCHAGVAPFAYHSGQNTATRARVSHRADKSLKTLLHMGALSAIGRQGELRDYYQRKCSEGKARMSVINAIRAKLVHRMFAVIKRNEEYVPVLA